MAHTLDDYTIAWICALPLEAAAARAMLDKIHNLPERARDPNAYEFGELNGHHIVIAHLPNGIYGTVSAAAVVSRMRLTFPRLQFGLMVGIGGGVPSKNNDIRLGDVVVSTPGGRHGGVIQYDYGKAVQDGQFELTGMLNQPPQALLTHISQIRAKQMTAGGDVLSFIISQAQERNPSIEKELSCPVPYEDLLFCASYHHADKESDCGNCDKEQLVNRQPRQRKIPYIHYGLIASGDKVIKDPETRDRLAKKHGILCFEMEAAGLMNELPTLVIRGICDYCDTHKQKQWQGYAALTAAAYTKLLISELPVFQVKSGLLETRETQHWVVPLFRNPNFVGRLDEINKLEEQIMMRDSPRRIAITGLGGIGKTQVALEVAHRIREKDKECSIFWIPCTSHALIQTTFLKIAETVGISNIKPAEIKHQMTRYFSSRCAGKWLLIYDNVDDTDMWLATSEADPALENFLPQSEQGQILITTRNRKLASKLAPFNIIQIPNEDRTTAFQIMQRLLTQEVLVQHNTTAASLLEQLAFLPLAITQASAYIIENGIQLSDYLALLQEQERDAVELLSEDFSDLGRYKDIQNPVLKTWLISFTQLQHQNQYAASYLCFMACINPRNIPRSLLPPRATKKQTLDALGLLDAYSFTNIKEADISLHRLVHLATRNWLRTTDQFDVWIQNVADHMQKVFPSAHYTNRGLWRAYLPHALALVHEDEFVKQHENYTQFIENIADCLASDGRYSEAEAQYKVLMEVNQAKYGNAHIDTLTSMSNLVSTYRNQGRWNEAEKLQVQVLETSKTVLGAEHPNTLISMGNLALIYSNRGRWNKAEKLEAQVIEMRKTVLGAEHPDTLISMGNLALTYQNQGRWNEAEKLQVQVIEMRDRILGVDHPDTLISVGNLALIYLNQGRWNEAEKLQVHVMETSNMVLGAKHPNTLRSMGNLASTYLSQGRWYEAERLQIQEVETSITLLGADHPNTLTSIGNLAATHHSQGRWGEAEKLQVQVMEVSKIVLGIKHPNTLRSMGNLASNYWSQGRWYEAERLQIQEVERSITLLGADHPNTLTSIGNLAATHHSQGRWGEAEKLQVQVMETSKRVLGPKHPDTLLSMSNLAFTRSNQGRWSEAEKLRVQVLAIRKIVLGPEHPDTLTSMINLSSTYRYQGRWDLAEKLQVQVTKTSEMILGAEHVITLTSMINLSSTYRYQGRWDLAEKLQVQVLETRKTVLGAEHPDTLTSINDMASIYRLQGRLEEAEKLQVQVLETRKTVLGAEHPDTLTSINDMASIYRLQGRLEEAEKLQVQVLETRKTVLGAKHPDCLTSMANLASILKSQQRLQHALALITLSCQLCKEVMGPGHHITRYCCRTLFEWQNEHELSPNGILSPE